tara:strand:+ start:204 stop:947 length:744 start_codon:yes stop_codon:yes gene_type:complete
MEDVENTNKVVKNGFINHVFNFDNDTKTEVLNVGQYLLLAIIPMGFYNYMVDSVIPEVDESKSNLEILAEVVGQLTLVLVGMFFIHRLITYVPTYSGRAMGDMNLFSIILLLLVLLYESHTKVGEKTKILLTRVSDMWHGKKDDDKKKKGKKDGSVVKVSQPISRAGMPTHQPSRADYLNAHNAMSSPTQMLPPQNPPSQQIPQTDSGASNNIYNSGGFGGLQDANTPSMSQEPMAANAALGGFSSW